LFRSYKILRRSGGLLKGGRIHSRGPARYFSLFAISPQISPHVLCCLLFATDALGGKKQPMMRAQQEWKRHGSGPWDYSKNGPSLRGFWEQGLARKKDFEHCVTVHEPCIYGRDKTPLELALNGKQIPQFIGNNGNASRKWSGQNKMSCL